MQGTQDSKYIQWCKGPPAPNMEGRNRNGNFFAYIALNKEKYLNKQDGMKYRDVIKLLAAKWKDMDSEERKKYRIEYIENANVDEQEQENRSVESKPRKKKRTRKSNKITKNIKAILNQNDLSEDNIDEFEFDQVMKSIKVKNFLEKYLGKSNQY